MTTKQEIILWEKAKKILQKDIYAKHGITEMDINCPECVSAIMVAFINQRLDVLTLPDVRDKE